MMQENHQYIAIDLKSFYASVECVERGYDPLKVNLVVADISRTEKTICLAVSPSLKAYRISGRARLFEVVSQVKNINSERRKHAPGHKFTGASFYADELDSNPGLSLDYITAPPRMGLYMDYSTKIYKIYLNFIAPEDIHVYSIDEVFIDATHYLKTYQMSARELAKKLVHEVLRETKITATAGIGTNLYLCKVAMDIEAKHIQADEDGVRIAELDEISYRQKLWNHRPLTDFWRIGRGYAAKLEANGMHTMGDVARCSIGDSKGYYNEKLLYKLFGINAELLIDHAWGWEPVTLAEIKAYRPATNSISTGQVLKAPYDFLKARLIVQEMADLLALDLVDKQVITDQIVLTVGYDIGNITDSSRRNNYHGEVTTDHYGRKVPKHAHGSVNIGKQTSSGKLIIEATLRLYDRIVNPNLLVRRVTIAANHVVPEDISAHEEGYEQLDLFTDYEKLEAKRSQEKRELEREKKMQQAVLQIKKKYGKNALLKGMNLKEGAMTIERNKQIGGHKA